MITIILTLIVCLLISLVIFLSLHLRYISLLNRKFLLEHTELKELLKKIQNQIETFLLHLPIPVLLLDKTGTIKFANSELKNIVDNTPEGHNYIEFFNQPEFIEAIHQVLENRNSTTKELLYKGKTYIASFCFSGTTEEIFIALKDITKTEEISKIKKELISNISHELKTPLTVIQGYLETIYDEVAPAVKKQVEIVKTHTERLASILSDLLKLSELEEIEIEFQQVDIKNIIEKIVRIFEKKLISKNLSLTVEIDKVNRYISGDPYKLEDLLINLIDNAIKYTDEGEITIITERTDNNLVIRIKDTGIGIPEKSIPRIFERFYVVDKSRSRETGGTGLGLAIVKHIVLLHNGTIDIKSSLGEGTEVIVSLPLKPTYL